MLQKRLKDVHRALAGHTLPTAERGKVRLGRWHVEPPQLNDAAQRPGRRVQLIDQPCVLVGLVPLHTPCFGVIRSAALIAERLNDEAAVAPGFEADKARNDEVE